MWVMQELLLNNSPDQNRVLTNIFFPPGFFLTHFSFCSSFPAPPKVEELERLRSEVRSDCTFSVSYTSILWHTMKKQVRKQTKKEKEKEEWWEKFKKPKCRQAGRTYGRGGWHLTNLLAWAQVCCISLLLFTDLSKRHYILQRDLSLPKNVNLYSL